jgi:hypothetical protein
VTAARAWLLAILAFSAAAGIGMYYLQVYAFYEELEGDQAGPVTLALIEGGSETLPASDLHTIARDSSPISFRACWQSSETPEELALRFVPFEDPRPPNAPGWFDCFDARAIGEALEAGEARAFLGVKDIRYGIDRVVAVLPDGRGFSWHQINACGEVVFDGDPPPPGCPPLPERAE